MTAKRALITGANSGMGLATTIELAKKGFEVIMVCRNEERGNTALEEAKRQSGSDSISLMTCDLASLASIRAFSDDFMSRYSMLDVLINNAGVVTVKRETTQDGFEMMLGVNHLGHFLLTNLLLDPLKKSQQGRIINVGSGAHKSGKTDFNNPHLTTGFGIWRGYSQSKLANNLFTVHLSKKLKDTSVTVNCLHPGAVSTAIGVNRQTGFGKSVHAVLRPFFLTPLQGAETAIYLADSPEVTHISGAYFYKKRVTPPSSRAKNERFAEEFWNWSAREVGL
ncbi:SDR family oxidoreductase [Priestia sp. TSO9]|uniref:SDR family oxidoreductase n=1 Tax=Priestia sp. TSO9 TaxID=2885632 RepID=UPI001E3004E6|nr:SDR family oxidoreductase [Priestia sp. TSO9]